MVDTVLIIFVVTTILFLVSLLLPIADRLAIPYTVLLAALGMGLGYLAVNYGYIPELGPIGDVLQGLGRLGFSAEAFIFIFLPPLLFTAGLTIDVRLMIDELSGVLLLAVVAVMVTTVVVGYSLNAFTDIGLVACLLLGSIVATTDPAAVISIFRDLGAPRRLTTLVAGESLFNDAAAIAIFTLLLDVLVGAQQLDIWAGMGAFLVDFIGGALAGYLLARLVCSLLRRMRNTPVAEITLSVALAYLTFIVGEVYLQVSGVVAVVTAALTFAVYGQTQVRPGTWAAMIATWSQLEFWANSLIFVLAALLASRLLPEAKASDLALLAIVVVAALGARALVLFGMLPLLSAIRLTEPVSSRHKAVILWGGVRGAITMVLALSVSQNPFVPASMQQFVSVLAVGFALFTLFVNAPTLRPFLRLMGLDRLSATESILRNRVMALSRAAIRDQVMNVAKDYGFDPKLAMKVSPQDTAWDEEEGGEQEQTQPLEPELPEESRLKIGLLTIANRERELYLEHFSEGTISRRMVAVRVTAADRLIDRVKTAGSQGYEQGTGADVRILPLFRFALWLHRRIGWAGPLARQITDRFETLLATELVIRELRRFNRRDVRPVLGMATSAALSELLGRRLETVGGALAAIELQYSSLAEAMRSQYLARAGIRFEEAEYRRKLEESLINREVFKDLQRELDTRRQAINRQPPLDLGLGLTEMIARVEVFAGLDRERLLAVARLLRPRIVMPGERILTKGTRGRAMYFVASGSVEIALSGRLIKLSAGDFFGELALLTKRPRHANVTASAYCHLLVLEARDFHHLLRGDPVLKERIETIANQRLAENRELGST